MNAATQRHTQRHDWPACLHVLERGWVSSNNILFLGERDVVLVDTGYGRHAPQTLALLQRLLAGRALDRIVNTHTHSDHIGGNAALKRAWPRVHITIPAGEAQAVREWDEMALLLPPLGQECERFAFDATFTHGDVLDLGGLQWRAIGSPGHDMDSLVLHCAEERILISADALWENGFGVLFPEFTGEAAPGAGCAAQRATLDAIAALDVDWVIPGHGSPFTDMQGALKRAYGRLDSLASDPVRNARNAAKVALAFVLMIEGRILLAEIPHRLAAMSFVQRLNHEFLRIDDGALAGYLIGELEKSHAARREGEWLVVAQA